MKRVTEPLDVAPELPNGSADVEPSIGPRRITPNPIHVHDEYCTHEDPVAAALKSFQKTLLVLVSLVALLTFGTLLLLGNLVMQGYDIQAQTAGLSAQLAQIRSGQLTNPSPAAPQDAAKPAGIVPAKALTGSVMPKGVDSTGAVLLGDPNGKTVVETFVDYQCPFCQKWEAQYGETLAAAALKPNSGILLKQYNMAFLGEQGLDLAKPGASGRAANAALCVVDTSSIDAYVKFSQSVFKAADPSEPPSQFPVNQLVKLADTAGADPKATACIKAGTFMPAVSALTQASFARGVSGTPTVTVNGVQTQNPFSDPALAGLAKS